MKKRKRGERTIHDDDDVTMRLAIVEGFPEQGRNDDVGVTGRNSVTRDVLVRIRETRK